MGTQKGSKSAKKYWWQQGERPFCASPSPKPGQICPRCQQGKLTYNGLFILYCPQCGYVAASGAFT